MRRFICIGIALLVIASGVASTQDVSKKADATMTNEQHMMMSLRSSNKKLDDLVAQLNAARGNDRIDKLVAIVNELVAERKQMTDMMAMHDRMANMMHQHNPSPSEKK